VRLGIINALEVFSSPVVQPAALWQGFSIAENNKTLACGGERLCGVYYKPRWAEYDSAPLENRQKAGVTTHWAFGNVFVAVDLIALEADT
jgi:hypothetical protein